MLPHEATNMAYGSDRKAIAAAQGVSLSLVEKHCVAPRDLGGEGRCSPAQRVIEACLAARAAGDSDWRFLLRYIARELGCVVVAVDEGCVHPEALDQVAKATREFGDVLGATAEATLHGAPSLSDSERIVAESEDVIVALFSLRREHMARIVRAEAAIDSTRRGPHRTTPRIHELRMEAIA